MKMVRKRDEDWVEQAWRFEVEGSRGKGRPRLAWKGMMENLCRRLDVGLEDVYDRVKWRGLGHGKKSVTPWKTERC